MRFLKSFVAVLLMVMSVSVLAATNPAEREIIERYSRKIQKKQTRKLAWISGSFTLNRINQNNDYNKFAAYESNNFSNSSIKWLDQAKAFSLEYGMRLNDRISWNVSGEYWLKLGENNSGNFSYTPNGGLQTSVTDMKSEIKTYGVNVGLDYYLSGAPTVEESLSGTALKIGASVGYYVVNWDLWDSYQNLNLATDAPSAGNTTFKGTAPALAIGLGIEKPLKLAGLSAAIDLEYQYMNFQNVAWYNTIDQEVVATYGSSSDTRVDLALSGVRGRVELRRYFSW